MVDSQFPLSPIPRIQNVIKNQPKLQKRWCNLNLISTYNAYIKTKQHSNTANAYYIPFINHIHLTTLPLDREWVPAVCRGSHFWSPAPRLNNAPMVVTTAQPDHDPHITHCQSSFCTLTVSFNTLSPNSDQHQFSPTNIHTTSRD